MSKPDDKPVATPVQATANDGLPVSKDAGTVQATASDDVPFYPTGEGGSYIAVGGGKVIRAPVPKS